MSVSSQYFSHEGMIGNTTKTIVIDLVKCSSISITNDGTDEISAKFNQLSRNGSYIRTIKANETFTIDGNFYSVTLISPATGETNQYRIFALGE